MHTTRADVCVYVWYIWHSFTLRRSISLSLQGTIKQAAKDEMSGNLVLSKEQIPYAYHRPQTESSSQTQLVFQKPAFQLCINSCFHTTIPSLTPRHRCTAAGKGGTHGRSLFSSELSNCPDLRSAQHCPVCSHANVRSAQAVAKGLTLFLLVGMKYYIFQWLHHKKLTVHQNYI